MAMNNKKEQNNASFKFLGTMLKNLRDKKDWSRQKLADGINKSAETIRRYEIADQIPSLLVLSSMLGVLGFSFKDFRKEVEPAEYLNYIEKQLEDIRTKHVKKNYLGWDVEFDKKDSDTPVNTLPVNIKFDAINLSLKGKLNTDDFIDKYAEIIAAHEEQIRNEVTSYIVHSVIADESNNPADREFSARLLDGLETRMAASKDSKSSSEGEAKHE